MTSSRSSSASFNSRSCSKNRFDRGGNTNRSRSDGGTGDLSSGSSCSRGYRSLTSLSLSAMSERPRPRILRRVTSRLGGGAGERTAPRWIVTIKRRAFVHEDRLVERRGRVLTEAEDGGRAASGVADAAGYTRSGCESAGTCLTSSEVTAWTRTTAGHLWRRSRGDDRGRDGRGSGGEPDASSGVRSQLRYPRNPRAGRPQRSPAGSSRRVSAPVVREDVRSRRPAASACTSSRCPRSSSSPRLDHESTRTVDGTALLTVIVPATGKLERILPLRQVYHLESGRGLSCRSARRSSGRRPCIPRQ